MTIKVFNMKLNENDQRLIAGLMAKHGLTKQSDLVRRALAHFVSAPVAQDSVLEALKDLETFTATKAQLARHKAANLRISKGERGLGLEASLALLNKLRSPKRPTVAVKQVAK